MRVAFFTAGTTGAGHIVRGLAIGRALRRRAPGTEYAIFAPRVPFCMGPEPAALIREVTVDHQELADPARAAVSGLAQALRAYAPDVLLVDLFWAPLLRILRIPPLSSCEAWLLLRSAPDFWLVGPPGHLFDRHLFARVLAIEPGVAARHADETIEPIVIANPDEARPRRALRDALGVPDGEHLALVHQAGDPGEWASLVDREAQSVHVFTFARDDAPDATEPPPGVRAHDGAAFFPLATWLAGADSIVSGAGYNAFWEARWLGHAARTRFVPFARKIDDQAWRVRACASHEMRENGADVLARRLR